MIRIKKHYKNQTKSILKFMNERYYHFDKVSIIIECDNTFTIQLNDITNTEFRILNQKVLIEIINAVNDFKIIDIKLSDYIIKLVLSN